MIDNFDVLKVLDMDYMDLDISQDICNILRNNKIETVEDIISYTEEEMLFILGEKKHIEELTEKLTLLGLDFKYCKRHKDIDKTVEDLDLSVRAYNVLKRAGINTVADLMHTGISEIRRRTSSGLNRKVFAEISLKLEEIGFDLIEMETKKIIELQKLLEQEKNQKIVINPIEIKNIEVNEYCQLIITFSKALEETWVKTFKKVRARFFGYKDDVAEYVESAPKVKAKKIIKEIELTVDSTTASCSAEDILESENHKEVLICFIEYLEKILNLTQNEYAKCTKRGLIRTRQVEINKTLDNISVIKSFYIKQDKRVTINKELRDLIKRENKK